MLALGLMLVVVAAFSIVRISWRVRKCAPRLVDSLISMPYVTLSRKACFFKTILPAH